MKTFVDVNVLLEAILQNRKKAEAARLFLETANTVLSPLSAHLFVYFGKKDGLPLDVLLTLLAKHSFTDFGAQEVLWAINNHQGDDFEDALQVACAVLNGCRSMVTFDKQLAQKYQKFINIQIL